MLIGTFDSLPTETKLEIIEFLDADGNDGRQALLNLSLTSRDIRELCLPKLFASMTVFDDGGGGCCLKEFAESPGAIYIKSLIIKPNTFIEWIEESDEADPSENKSELWQKENLRILSDPSCLPKLNELILEYCFDISDTEIDILLELDQYDVLLSNKWITVLDQAFDAISKEENSQIKSLKLLNIVPIPIPFWSSPRFHKFLSSLEQFSLSVRGYDHEDVGANGHQSYQSFARCLPEFFFNHLTNVTKFEFACSETGPMGQVDRGSVFGVRPGHMPLLTFLSVSHLFVTTELANFIAHHPLLETIKVENCWATSDRESLSDLYFSWADFLNSVADSCPTNLQSLRIRPNRAPLCEEEVPVSRYVSWGDYYPTQEEIQEEKRLLEDNPNMFVFAYASLHDPGCFVQLDVWGNVFAFNNQHDQRAYDRLMDIVKSNVLKKKSQCRR